MSIQGLVGDIVRNLKKNPAAFIRYVLSGIATIGFYTGVLIVLIEVMELSRGLSVGIGMVLAGLLNYLLVKWLVFRSKRQHHEAAPRYVAVLLGNIGANMGVTWLACDLGSLPYGPVQVLYFTVATITVYFVMRRWVMFQRRPWASDGE